MKNSNKLIIIFVVMCSIGLLIEVIKRDKPIATNCRREDKPVCPKGVITVIDGGRLCNKIFEYVSVWAISRSYGLVPYVPNVILYVLRRLFTHLSIPPISKLVESLGNCSKINHNTLNKPNNDVTHLEVTARKTSGSEYPFVLRKYIILVDSIVPLVGELKEEFKYQPVYINIAQARLQRARAIMNDKHGNREVTLLLLI
ncbi:unnamed protein product [Timema podura]|uniref:Uncharacterized protein n=1 Tax=Timema podura TaxID=61482 RepID=A0ABN7NHN2_TIMPD|nr:unnamed protein product [Timema podura]